MERRYFYLLSLGALGVVYGDIGTSPLYAVRECFRPKHGVPATPENVLGILSLIFWSLVIVISMKCKVVHRTVVILTVVFEETPRLQDEERFEWSDVGHGVHRLFLRFGFMEEPDLPATLQRIGKSPSISIR